MTKTAAERQADFRRKRVEMIEGLVAAKIASSNRIDKLEQALRDVIQLTGDKQGESAVAIRAVCMEALG